MLRNLELEEAILADLENRETFAVYADWLAERGDPRGELINVQLARELRPDDAELADRERELLAAGGGDWLGILAPGSPWPTRAVEVRWRRGFVDAATIQTMYETNESAMGLAELATLPVACAVRELRLGVACSYGGSGGPDESILEALRDTDFRALRSVTFDNFDFELSWTHVGDLSIANHAMRGVEMLEVIAGNVELGAIDLPRLRRLRIETGGLRPSVPASITAAGWPALESLVVYFGTPDYGGSCEVTDAAGILDGASLPRVTTLGLCNSMFGDELAARVASSRILPRLTRLDMSMGTLGTDGARAILREAAAFAHLEHLDLSNNYLSAEDCEQLATVARSVDVSVQKQEEGYGRFVTVSE